MKRLALVAIAIVVVSGCAKEDSSASVDVSSDVAASFNNASISTRTSGSDWEADDLVGIYMYESSKTDDTYYLVKENVAYSSDESGSFTLSATELEPIYYPQTDVVDFYAYYPYQAGVGSGTTYTADITAQNLADGSFDQGAVDFMTASLTEKSKSTESLSFEFSHKLSMITLVITPKSSVEAKTGILDGVVVKLEDINTQATFNTLTGDYIASKSLSGVVELLTENSETDGTDVTKVTAVAIVLPETMPCATSKITFCFNDGTSHTALFPSDQTFEAGINYTYNISVGYQEASFNNTTNPSTITGWGNSDSVSSDTIDAEETI